MDSLIYATLKSLLTVRRTNRFTIMPCRLVHKLGVEDALPVADALYRAFLILMACPLFHIGIGLNIILLLLYRILIHLLRLYPIPCIGRSTSATTPRFLIPIKHKFLRNFLSEVLVLTTRYLLFQFYLLVVLCCRYDVD